MPRFDITHPDGRVVTVEGESAPTEQDAEQIFASLPTVKAPPAVPERRRALDVMGGVPAPGQLSNPSAVEDNPEQRFVQAQMVKDRMALRKEEQDFHAANFRPDVRLNTRKGLPAMLSARLSAEPDPAVQVKMLNDKGIPARLSKDGKKVIAEHEGEDVLLNPYGAPGIDSLARNAVPIAKGVATIAAAIPTGGMSLPLAAASMGMTAGAIEGISTGTSRLAAGQPPGDLPERMLKEGAINAALPLALAAPGAAAQGARKLLTRNPSPLATEAVEASKRTGVPLFSSQVADSKVLARGESMAGLKSQNDAQQMAMRTAFDRELGPSGPLSVITEADLAKKVQPGFQAEADAAEKAARITMTDAERDAQRLLKAQLDSGLIPAGASNTAVSRNTVSKLQEFVDKTKAQAEIDYPVFHQQLADEGIVGNKGPFIELVESMLGKDPHGIAQELAPSFKQVTKVGEKLEKPLVESAPVMGMNGKPLSDQFGNPLMTTEVPSPPLTAENAIGYRSLFRKKLAAPEAPLGDVVSKYYKQAINALTDIIGDGKAGMPPDSILARASQTARDLYAKARGPYAEGADAVDRGIVDKLLRGTGEPGHIPEENVVNQLFTGGGKLEALRDMKAILGANSADYKLLLRQGIQNMIDDAASKGSGGLIKVSDLAGDFAKMSPEMRAEVFGPLEAPLKATLDAFTVAQGGAAKAAKIPADELADALLSAPGSVKNLINQSVARQRHYETEYTNSLMAKLSGRNLGIKDLGNLDRFVSEIVPKASAADMRQLLTKIEAHSPGAAEEFRQVALSNLRSDAVKAMDDAGESFILKPEAIGKIFEKGEAEKYRVIFGDKTMEVLKDLEYLAKSHAQRTTRGLSEPFTPLRLATYSLASGVVGGAAHAMGVPGVASTVLGAAAPFAMSVPKLLAANLERSEAVRNFIKTGVLPALPPGATRAVSGATPTVNAVREVSEGLQNERAGTPPLDLPTLTVEQSRKLSAGTRFKGSNGATYEATGNGKNKFIESAQDPWQEIELPGGGSARVRRKK